MTCARQKGFACGNGSLIRKELCFLRFFLWHLVFTCYLRIVRSRSNACGQQCSLQLIERMDRKRAFAQSEHNPGPGSRLSASGSRPDCRAQFVPQPFPIPLPAVKALPWCFSAPGMPRAAYAVRDWSNESRAMRLNAGPREDRPRPRDIRRLIPEPTGKK